MAFVTAEAREESVEGIFFGALFFNALFLRSVIIQYLLCETLLRGFIAARRKGWVTLTELVLYIRFFGHFSFLLHCFLSFLHAWNFILKKGVCKCENSVKYRRCFLLSFVYKIINQTIVRYLEK